MVSRVTPDEKVYVFESRRGQKLIVFTLLVTLTISDNKSHTFIGTIRLCGAMVSRLTPDQKFACSNLARSKTLRLYFTYDSYNISHMFICRIRPCCAMVARLSPDQKVTCSNRVAVKSFSYFLYLLLLQFLIINRTHSCAQLGLVVQC